MSEREPRTKPIRPAIAALLGSLMLAGTDAAPAEQSTSIRDQFQASFTPGSLVDSEQPPDDIIVA